MSGGRRVHASIVSRSALDDRASRGKMGAAARALLGFDPATALAPEAPIAVSQGLAPLPWSSRALSTDTAALVERCQVGDREALGELYRRFKGEAMRFIRHAVRDGRDAAVS